MTLHEVGAGGDSDRMTAAAGADTPSAADRLSPSAVEVHAPGAARFAGALRKLAESIDLRRCPICGGLNPGDVSHTRCI